MIDRANAYANRLKQLGWTEYKLAAEVARRRTEAGQPTTTQQIYSTVRKCVNDPDNSKQCTNDEIITAMRGEHVIRWTTYEEVQF